MSLLSSKDNEIMVPALRCFGNLMTINDDSKITQFIANGAFDKIASLLQSPNGQVVKESLWLLSNFTAGPAEHATYFLESNAFDRVMVLATC